MSNFQGPPGKINEILTRLKALESRVSKYITQGGFRSDGSGTNIVGVLFAHLHTGTGEGGTLDYKGTDSIASGTTAKAVTHGCGFTPTISQISITFSENPTNDPGNIWISAIGGTTFTVNCRADPGASNLDFGWRVSPT